MNLPHVASWSINTMFTYYNRYSCTEMCENGSKHLSHNGSQNGSLNDSQDVVLVEVMKNNNRA